MDFRVSIVSRRNFKVWKHVKTKLALFAAFSALLLVALGLGNPAGAHTESDVVAVPANSEATITLKPTHGCGGSPTVEVAIQAPVENAKAKDVPGWTATNKNDGKGNTVLEWKGSSLPADQTGKFPVEFRVPNKVGELLLFPAVQTCENGEELSWISGDPADEYPASRLLVLAEGAAPAHSIDEVPADAPGRDQLQEIVDVDGQATTEETTTTTPEQTTTTGNISATQTSANEAERKAAAEAAEDSDDGGSNTGLIVGIVAAVAVLAGGGYWVAKRK